MAALVQLDGADVEVLAYIGRTRKAEQDEGQSYFRIRDLEKPDESLAEQLPHLARLLEAIVGRLEMLGIISGSVDAPTWGGLATGTTWYVTEFGHLCVGRLLAEGTY